MRHDFLVGPMGRLRESAHIEFKDSKSVKLVAPDSIITYRGPAQAVLVRGF